MKSKRGSVNFEREESINILNEELHRIYGLVNSVEMKYLSTGEIDEIKEDLQYFRRKLQLFMG